MVVAITLTVAGSISVSSVRVDISNGVSKESCRGKGETLSE